MEQLNLLAYGRDHHLSALKQNYEALKKKIMANVKLSNSDRTSELKKS